MSNLAGVIYKIGILLTLRELLVSTLIFVGVRVAHVLFFVFFFMCPMFPVSLGCLFLNVLRFSLTFFFVVASKLKYRDREYIVPLLFFAKTDIQICLSSYLVLLPC